MPLDLGLILTILDPCRRLDYHTTAEKEKRYEMHIAPKTYYIVIKIMMSFGP